MANLVKTTENLYKQILLANQFPAAYSFFEKLISVRAIKQHFAERRFLKEKETQISTVTLALTSAYALKMKMQIDEEVQAYEVEKAVELIKRAMEMDTNYFLKTSDHMVANALSFLKKYENDDHNTNISDHIQQKEDIMGRNVDKMLLYELIVNRNDVAELDTLLNSGVSANTPLPSGESMLSAAAGMGDARLDVTKILVKHGADINEQSGGLTLLSRLKDPVFCDNEETLAFLISKGAK